MDLHVTVTPTSPDGTIEHAEVVRTVARIVADRYPGCQVQVEDREHGHEVRVPCVAPGSLASMDLPAEAVCPCKRGIICPRDGETSCALCRMDARRARRRSPCTPDPDRPTSRTDAEG